MTKSEARELQKIETLMTLGMRDTAARSLSALIRATRSRATSFELMQRAVSLDLVHLPDFIV
jgi:hypothetical protein